MQSKSETELGYSSLIFSKALLIYISLTNSLDHCTHREGTRSGSDTKYITNHHSVSTLPFTTP